jgi:hypothetical protein
MGEMEGEGKLNELTHERTGCRETRERSHASLNESSRDRVSRSTAISNST